MPRHWFSKRTAPLPCRPLPTRPVGYIASAAEYNERAALKSRYPHLSEYNIEKRMHRLYPNPKPKRNRRNVPRDPRERPGFGERPRPGSQIARLLERPKPNLAGYETDDEDWMARGPKMLKQRIHDACMDRIRKGTWHGKKRYRAMHERGGKIEHEESSDDTEMSQSRSPSPEIRTQVPDDQDGDTIHVAMKPTKLRQSSAPEVSDDSAPPVAESSRMAQERAALAPAATAHQGHGPSRAENARQSQQVGERNPMSAETLAALRGLPGSEQYFAGSSGMVSAPKAAPAPAPSRLHAANNTSFVAARPGPAPGAWAHPVESMGISPSPSTLLPMNPPPMPAPRQAQATGMAFAPAPGIMQQRQMVPAYAQPSPYIPGPNAMGAGSAGYHHVAPQPPRRMWQCPGHEAHASQYPHDQLGHGMQPGHHGSRMVYCDNPGICATRTQAWVDGRPIP